MELKTGIIEGFPRYLAREDGEIISIKLNKPLSSWVDNVGYKMVVLYNPDGKRCYKRVHRLIGCSLLPNPSNYPQVNHIDGDKTNCSLNNLEWVTNSQNTQHGYRSGMYAFGTSTSYAVKVTNKESKEEREFKSIRECATGLGLNRKTISSILNSGKTNNYAYEFEYVQLSSNV